MTPTDRALALLDKVRSRLDAGEDRPGQRDMVSAITDAIGARRHVVIQAGTGTGKSLGYLVPAVSMRRRTVIATATKALQDQLSTNDLPLLAAELDRPLTWAVLKGRSNYLCLQRLDEATGAAEQLDLGDSEPAGGATPAGAAPTKRGATAVPERRLRALRDWADQTDTGDRADLDEEPPGWVWQAVSVGPRECPGAKNCPRGEDCFAELARKRAATADVIIVNTHLYGLHLGSRGAVLPDHDVVVFDEAHEVEDIITSTTGLQLGPGSFTNLARLAGGLIADPTTTDAMDTAASRFELLLEPLVGSRLRRGVPSDVADLLNMARGKVGDVMSAVRNIDSDSVDVRARATRVTVAAGALVLDIDAVMSVGAESVMWVGGTPDSPRLELAPLDVGLTLDSLLWDPEPTGLEIDDGSSAGSDDDDPRHGLPDTVVFTSATVPPGLVARLRVPSDEVTELDVGTPFNFADRALLYCAAHLPEPRSEKFGDAVVDELEQLINVAEGRTLALFTSHRAMEYAAAELAKRLKYTVLKQGDQPKPALVEAFRNEESSCLFATMGFWAGIDVPGPTLSLVTIDKLPFPRPDDPLHQARRERAGASGFTTVDLPRTATMLAQGAGRLIRNATDRGVVAVLDRRLATSASYRWELINALPPMKRTKSIDDVAAFFAEAETQ